MSQRPNIKTEPNIAFLRKQLLRFAAFSAVLSVMYYFTHTNCQLYECTSERTKSVNTLGQSCLIVASILITYLMVRRDSSSLWTPAVMFPAGTALYFGFGTMSALYSSQSTQYLLMAGTYAIDSSGLIRTNLLTMVGVTVTVLSMCIGMSLRWRNARSQRRNGMHIMQSGASLQFTAICFLILGGIVKYGLVLPAQYGIIDVTVPGTLKSLTPVMDLGFALAAYLAVRGKATWALLFWCLLPLHFGVTLLEFSKRSAMYAILLPAAGAFLAHRKWFRMLPWLIAAGSAYFFLQNVNTTARLTILDQTGTLTEANFGERLDILRQTINGELDLEAVSSVQRAEAQTWWLRLNYSGAQLRAMELYDQGIKGEWDLTFLTTFVPRFLWPEKPLATSQGREFNRIVSGNYDARVRVGMSVYADGYWQFGWVGTFLFSSIMGLTLGIVTRISHSVLSRGQLIYLPIVFLGMQMALLGPLGYLQKSIVGALPIYLGYLVLISVLERLTARKQTSIGIAQRRSSALRSSY